MKEILLHSKNNMGFIYSVSSGGCNGYNFKLHPIKEKEYNEIIKNKYHTILNNDETKLYIDPMSEMFLLGTKIDYIHQDYQKEIFESRFHFEVDKNKMTSCGCGISFSPKFHKYS